MVLSGVLSFFHRGEQTVKRGAPEKYDGKVEFIYREAKGHCGLTGSRARRQNKLDFHFNIALTAVNLANIEWLQRKLSGEQAFSLSGYKTMYNNDLL